MGYVNWKDDEELYIVKKFIREDDDGDDILLGIMIEAAKEMIVDAVGEYDVTSGRHKLLLLNVVSTLYDNRSYTDGKAQEKAQYTLKTMMRQLQLGEES